MAVGLHFVLEGYTSARITVRISQTPATGHSGIMQAAKIRGNCRIYTSVDIQAVLFAKQSQFTFASLYEILKISDNPTTKREVFLSNE